MADHLNLDHHSSRFHRPSPGRLIPQPYGAYGHIDPVSSVSRVQTALVDRGVWTPDMAVTDILALVRTCRMIGGSPMYDLYELYPLGPMDPDLVPSLLRRALRHHEQGHPLL